MAIFKERFDKDLRRPLAELLPLSTPLSIFIEPTNLCNFGCNFCPTGDSFLIKKVGKKRQSIELPLFNKILADIQGFPDLIKTLHLNKDGEPLLHKNFPDLVSLAKATEKFDRIETISNGSLLNTKMNQQLAQCGLSRIKFSLYGTSDLSYKKNVSRQVNFQSIIHNIQDLYVKGKPHGLEVFVKIMNPHLADTSSDDLFQMLSDKCDRFFIEECVENWPDFNVAEKINAVNNQKTVFGIDRTGRKDICTMPFYSLSVNATGSVSVCCVDWENTLLIGDANSESIVDIWNGHLLRNWRQRMIDEGRFLIPICKDCVHPEQVQPDFLDNDRDFLRNMYF